MKIAERLLPKLNLKLQTVQIAWAVYETDKCLVGGNLSLPPPPALTHT